MEEIVEFISEEPLIAAGASATIAADQKAEGEFRLNYASLAKQNWWFIGKVTLIGIIIGLIIYIILYYFGKKSFAYGAAACIVAVLVVWFFSGNVSLRDLALFVGGTIVLTIILTFFIFIVYDLLGRRYDPNGDLPPDI